MAESGNGSRSKCEAETDAISSAIIRAGRQAIIEHARLGRSVPYLVNGKVVWVTPDEILAKFENQNNGPADEGLNGEKPLE